MTIGAMRMHSSKVRKLRDVSLLKFFQSHYFVDGKYIGKDIDTLSVPADDQIGGFEGGSYRDFLKWKNTCVG